MLCTFILYNKKPITVNSYREKPEREIEVGWEGEGNEGLNVDG